MAKDLNAMNVGTQRSANVNNPNPRPLGARSSFPDNAHRHATTLQYGNIGVFDHFNTVRHDELNFRNQHEIHSYTLASPMMSGVTINKTYVRVPYKAIYPKNWDIMLPLPTKGDDVPADIRSILSPDFFSKIKLYWDTLVRQGATFSKATYLKKVFDYVFLLESLFSTGSVFSQLNINLHPLFSYRVDGVSFDYDDFFDSFFVNSLSLYDSKNLGFQFPDFGGLIFHVGDSFVPLDDAGYESQNWSAPIGYLVSLLRHYDYSVVWKGSSALSFPNFFSLFNDSVSDFFFANPGSINIESIVAYQLACYQFFTNEHVDFIYSADLFRRALISSYYYASDTTRLPVFGWNGELLEYDIFSGGTFDAILSRWSGKFTDESDFDFFVLSFFRNLFSINLSLRYGDYFTGARPQPLAVGDYSVDVVNGSVDTLEQVRGMQLVRLANNANLAGSKVGNYLQALWGGDLPEAPDDIPTFLVHQSFAVKGFEVENTGDAQVSDNNQIAVTTQLRTTDNKHVFQYFEDRDYSIILGLASFDCERFYSNTCDRFAFHYDRYDDFIPEMQYLGDQPILARELDIRNNQLAPVAYTVRNMEYKQKYSHASGGFIKRLPSWLFVADNETGIPMIGNISPSYIRSIPAEFDRFYKSLTGYSLGTRFHFIVKFSNVDHAIRQMVYQPQILK